MKYRVIATIIVIALLAALSQVVPTEQHSPSQPDDTSDMKGLKIQ